MTSTDQKNAELIVRLTALTGPDREADFLLFEAVAFPLDYFGAKIESWSRAGGAGYTVNTADGIRHLSAFNAPHYTGSIDAALTLMPEGHAWYLRRNISADGDVIYCNAQVWPFCNPRDDESPTYWANADENNSAIALLIAILRARAVRS